MWELVFGSAIGLAALSAAAYWWWQSRILSEELERRKSRSSLSLPSTAPSSSESLKSNLSFGSFEKDSSVPSPAESSQPEMPQSNLPAVPAVAKATIRRRIALPAAEKPVSFPNDSPLPSLPSASSSLETRLFRYGSFIAGLYEKSQGSMPSQMCDELAEALVALCGERGENPLLISSLVHSEIASHVTADGATLFRSNNLASKTVRAWVALDMDAFLVHLYRPVFLELSKMDPSEVSYELDPLRLDKSVRIPKNTNAVLRITEMLAEPLLASLERVPQSVRSVIAIVHCEMIRMSREEQLARQVASSFIFLRYIGPYLMAPIAKTLLPQGTAYPARGVTLASKLIQALANELEGPLKEPFLTPLMEKLRPKYSKPFSQFLTLLCQPPTQSLPAIRPRPLSQVEHDRALGVVASHDSSVFSNDDDDAKKRADMELGDLATAAARTVHKQKPM